MLKTVLCVDIGTTSLKAGLFTADGEAVFLCRKSFSEPDDRYVAKQWMNALAQTVEKMKREIIRTSLRQSNNKEEISIEGICISGAGPTLVLESGLTLRWNEELPKNLYLTSFEKMSLFIPRILMLRLLFEEEYQKSSMIFSGPEFLIYQMTKKAVTILPEKRFERAYWNDERLLDSKIEAEKLPAFVEVGAKAGNLTKEAADLLKLPEGLPVFTGAPDFVVALIGTNTLQPGRLCDRAGSSEGFNFCSDKQIFSAEIRTLPSVIPELWNISALTTESGRIFVEYKHRLEKERGKTIDYEKLVKEAVDKPNTEGGMILMKILNQVKESVDLLRKTLEAEGVNFPKVMAVTGGQAKNDLWMQKKADALGMTLEICNCADSELTGDACAAWYGLGVYESIQDAANHIVKVTKRFIPQNENI